MKITCALSKEHLLKLAAVIYKDIEGSAAENKPYDARILMNQLYDKLNKAQGEEVALSYMQQMPFLVGQIAFKESTNLIEDFGINNLFELNKQFRNEETGIQSLLNFFGKTIDLATLKLLSDEELNNPIEKGSTEVPIEPPVDSFVDQRFKVPLERAISLTWEEFMEMDPNLKVEDTIENLDQTKMTVYNTMNRLRNIVANSSLLDTIELDGNKVRLRAWSVTAFPSDLYYPSTAKVVERINTFQSGKAKDQGEVKPINEHFLAALTNEKGQILFFNEQGQVTTKEKGGKPVYQMLRDVRIENGKYKITDIYGREEMILGATQEARNRITQMGYKSIDVFEKQENTTFSDFVEDIETERQRVFKEYYDFRQSLIGMPGNRKVFMPIVDISNGVTNNRVKLNYLNLNNLGVFSPEQAEDILKSITVIDTKYNSIEDNRGSVNINGEIFEVDRPDISVDLANKIARVITAKDIDLDNKLVFTEQFFSNEMSLDVRRHWFGYDKKTKN